MLCSSSTRAQPWRCHGTSSAVAAALTLTAPILKHRTHRLQGLVALLSAGSLLYAAAWSNAWAQQDGAAPQNTLPALGDSDAEELNVGAERRLGDQIMREIRRDPDYLDDPVLLEYLRGVWQPLMAAARARGEISGEAVGRYAWEPFLVRSRSVNAFALPGGYVGVHLGLIALTTSGDQLASVLAHEMSHVTQRHIARNIANSKRASMLSIAATILGVLAASRTGSADGANAVLAGGQAAAIQSQLNFSRDMEREADRIGFGIMTQAGYAPGGMAALFEKLAQSSRLNDNNGFPYLRTHPLTTERIGEARSRMGIAPVSAPSADTLEHAIAQARAQVLMEPRNDALRRLQRLDTDTDTAVGAVDQLGAAYASALASTLLRDWSLADAALARAFAVVRGSGQHSDARALRVVTLLQVQSLLDRGDTQRALSVLATLASDKTRPLMLLRLQAALASTNPTRNGKQLELPSVVEDLQTWVALHPDDALAWGALSQGWEQLGQPLRALRASAESQLSLGDLRGASERLRAGQRLGRASTSPADFFEMSVIDARLRDVEAQRRAIDAEQRR